ncbi:hypothetical protein [Bradyrhizobium erythrophlei]|uniref:Helix-turn-helix domain-containing protein n=1 Tax=Bradyrhizobium erythrophlei TaxID=1437360 RepID=A0A1M7TEB9_9BRAD|nr:hypothetical protein [Bradyrhizobium erythrophlei]SHN69104.1 hypothetical protein SAMN05444170_1495 [Bradyrhizobium erythrophlei]
MATPLAHDAKIINLNEARGPDIGFRYRWLDRLHEDPERRHSTFAVAYALARRIDAKKAAPEVWPGIEWIAAKAKVSVSTAKSELKWLHDRGWLRLGKRRPKYVIRVLTMPEVADQPATVVADQPATITTTGSSPSTKEDNIHSAACAAPSSEPNQPGDRSQKSDTDIARLLASFEQRVKERCPRMYQQSPAEAARAWNELRQLDWPEVWGNDEMTHWHALLRKGYAADDIADFALNFMWSVPQHDVPSLGDFLQYFDCYRREAA